MIAKQIGSSSTKGTILYAGNKKGAELVASNDVFGKPESIAKQFLQVQKLNTRTKEENKTYHATISLSRKDAGKLSPEQEKKLMDDYAKKMGFENNQYAAWKHVDSNTPHFHFVANRINEDTGKAVSLSHNFTKHRTFCRAQEKELSLESGKGKYQKPSAEMYEQTNDTNHHLQILRNLIDQAIKKSKSFEEFKRRMKEEYRVNVYKGRGVSFGLGGWNNGATFKGSAIGRQYSLKGIEKQIAQRLEKLQNQKPELKLTPEQRIKAAVEFHNKNSYKGKIANISWNSDPLQVALKKQLGFNLKPDEIQKVHNLVSGPKKNRGMRR